MLHSHPVRRKVTILSERGVKKSCSTGSRLVKSSDSKRDVYEKVMLRRLLVNESNSKRDMYRKFSNAFPEEIFDLAMLVLRARSWGAGG